MMSEAPTTTILVAALAAYDAGLCVIRARTDGTKAPLGKWEQYQHQRPTRNEVEGWFATGHPGMGVVCGNVSGDLEMFELEGRFMEQHGAEFKRRIDNAGLELLFQRLIGGYQMESPKGGRNFIYRVDGPVDGNTKLARDPDNETLIETRGEGGFVVLAPSHGPTHPTGKPWKVRQGSVNSIPTITPDEREALFAVARSFDQGHTPTPPPPTATLQRTPASAWLGGHVGESWFDAVANHLAATEDMRTVLERHGWTYCYTDNRGRHLLRRPGKEEGVSGSINENGRFCPFSTSVPFATGGGGKLAPTYDLLDVIATYEHNGDREATARHYADTTGILDAWKAERTAELTIKPSAKNTSAPSETNLPEDFWTTRLELVHIRQAAHCRARSGDAVLLFTLARLAASIPACIVLPSILGGIGSLNFFGAVIGTSGSGKSTAGDVARELAPINRTDVLADISLGSGEGLIEAYFDWVLEEQADGKTKKVKRKTRDGLYMYLDEGQALAQMSGRKGSVILETLRSAWAGQGLGQTNASEETKRQIERHTYRLALMVGFQVEHAVGLLADAAGGTPQRFLFASAVDPTVPYDNPEWPGALDMTPPPTFGQHEIPVAPTVATEIRQRGVAATRGDITLAELDSHRNFVRLRTAALLGYLADRLDINEEDWQLAGVMLDTSDAVRRWVNAAAQERARRDELAGHARAARREITIAETIESAALKRAARAIGRRAQKVEELTIRDARHAIKSTDRQLVSVDEAIQEAMRMEWIEPIGDGWKTGKSVPL